MSLSEIPTSDNQNIELYPLILKTKGLGARVHNRTMAIQPHLVLHVLQTKGREKQTCALDDRLVGKPQ